MEIGKWEEVEGCHLGFALRLVEILRAKMALRMTAVCERSVGTLSRF
jgi:hypothetical protein